MKTHPLSDVSLKVRGFKSFSENYCELNAIKPINIVIGRNNVGKSSVIGAIQLLCTAGKSFSSLRHSNGTKLEVLIEETLAEQPLRQVFPASTSGGDIGQNHWDYGKQFIGTRITRRFGEGWNGEIISGLRMPRISEQAQRSYLRQISDAVGYGHSNYKAVVVATERKIVPETRNPKPSINARGDGVTNAIRAFITREDLPREQVTKHLLDDLNSIYQGDAFFNEIFCRENEEGIWEIFLKQKSYGDVRLSESGSSLQSVIILLSILRLQSIIEKIEWGRLVFCVEEPENNMRPSLLRRLLEFLASRRDEFGFTLFITTHSPVCIDWAARRDDVALIHATSDINGARASAAPTDQDRRRILDDLDIRASDILQSNGIVWVEGPSDRIYIRKWIELHSGGLLKEGIHYSIMFYGGKLLSHLDATSSDNEASALISLIKLNRNIAIVMDSDRHQGDGERKPRMQINGTKKRIKDECESGGAFVWVTHGREVENYISDRLQKSNRPARPTLRPALIHRCWSVR